MKSLTQAVLQSGVEKERNINTVVGKPLENSRVYLTVIKCDAKM
jgi:hypothetical protein